MAKAGKTNKSSSQTKVVYVLVGKDRRLAVDKLQELTEFLLDGADEQMALSSFEGGSTSLADVFDSLKTMPFLSDRRVVVIKDADEFITKYRQQLEEYLDNPSPTGVLVMLAGTFPKTTRLAKRVTKIGEIYNCAPVSIRQLPSFLIDYAKSKHQLRMDNRTAGILIELAGEDSGILVNEIDKISAYVKGPGNDSGIITTDDIQALVGNNRQYNVFSVIDAMTLSDTAKALTLLDRMLSQSRDAEYSAVGAFAWHFKRLYTARVMMDARANTREILKQAKVWNNGDKFIKQVSGMNTRQASILLRRLAEVDYAAKTGMGTVSGALEKLIVDFCKSRSM